VFFERHRPAPTLRPKGIRERATMTDLISILEEPQGNVYAALLSFALQRNTLFSLVWRDQLDFAESAVSVGEALQPCLLKQRRTHQWPGTELLGHLATVRLYGMSSYAVSLLTEAQGLYAWIAPERPEDLAFYTTEGVPWLASIAHEQEAFIYPHAVDPHELTEHVKGLRLQRAQPAG
jgi:hypothetical protein